MKHVIRWTLPASLLLASCSALCAASADSNAALHPGSTTEVAGSRLQLNGTGIGQRFVFKVYTISLYLAARKRTVEDVLNNEGPQRLSIVLLRDIDGQDLGQALLETMTQPAIQQQPDVSRPMSRIGSALADMRQGLRRGDRLTLDWVPGVGTVVELNQRRLTDPVPSKGLYQALLNIWLGKQPADPLIKAQLLGQRSDGTPNFQ